MPAPVYDCRFCHKPIEATEADVAEARAEADAVDDDQSALMTDAEIMDRFGRDICPACTGEDLF